MKNTSINKYVELKRRIYLIVFPILIITNLSYLLFSPYVDSAMKTFIPLLCLIIAVSYIFFYINRFMHTFEIIILLAFSVYHLNRVHLFTIQLEDMSNVYAMWSPFYFLFIFMVLQKRRALVYSLIIFFSSIVIGIPSLDNLRSHDTFIQYCLSTILCILILFFYQKITSTYIESDILRKNANYDALTNIGNRRLLETYLENEINRCQNSNDSFSIIYLDIDHFKQINDTYGHDIGDDILKEFTSLIKNMVPPTDLFGRWGGEEFIILTKHSLTGALEFSETIRKLIESHTFHYVNQVTCSFGISSFQHNDTPKTLIKRADEALYIAKNNGRNLVIAN